MCLLSFRELRCLGHLSDQFGVVTFGTFLLQLELLQVEVRLVLKVMRAHYLKTRFLEEEWLVLGGVRLGRVAVERWGGL